MTPTQGIKRMESISHYLTQEHVYCDDLFAEAENDVDQGDWKAAEQAFRLFHATTLHHFTKEEETLFPAFEMASGMTGGPTYVMRQEHSQMRDAMQAMADALAGRDGERYLGLSETLLMLMRQHNMKEEQMLYRMCDQALRGEAQSLIARMGADQAVAHEA
jgi:iron-sulfur cluster repair protein YtfE (RIC family)